MQANEILLAKKWFKDNFRIPWFEKNDVVVPPERVTVYSSGQSAPPIALRRQLADVFNNGTVNSPPMEFAEYQATVSDWQPLLEPLAIQPVPRRAIIKGVPFRFKVGIDSSRKFPSIATLPREQLFKATKRRRPFAIINTSNELGQPGLDSFYVYAEFDRRTGAYEAGSLDPGYRPEAEKLMPPGVVKFAVIFWNVFQNARLITDEACGVARSIRIDNPWMN